MRFYSIVMIQKRHISKKNDLKWHRKSLRNMLFYNRIVSDDFAYFLCHFKSIFLICAFCVSLLYYRISLFRFRQTLQKFLTFMHTSSTVFVIIFEIWKKISNPVVKQHVFERFYFFCFVTSNHFFDMCLLCIISILQNLIIQVQIDSQKKIDVDAHIRHTFCDHF